MPPATNKRSHFSPGRILGYIVIVAWLGFLGWAIWQRQAINDWLALHSYDPPVAVIGLADADTMTPAARHLFYLNKPQLESRSSFSDQCRTTEQTIVIGCYHGGQQGIYILTVTDARLDGIEQVTAAHEMLHAAYERLNQTEKARVDGWLENYYRHGLNNQRIKDTITAYKKTEPKQLVNEMHSIFGTEIAELPPQLEAYYQRYFENRRAVTTMAERYQHAFTSRREQVAAYDKQLVSLKAQIDAKQADLRTQNEQLAQQLNRLNNARRNDDAASYNKQVPAYNAAVTSYNQEVAATKQLIAQYNSLVEQRNAIALEEQQLVQSISGQTVSPIEQ